MRLRTMHKRRKALKSLKGFFKRLMPYQNPFFVSTFPCFIKTLGENESISVGEGKAYQPYTPETIYPEIDQERMSEILKELFGEVNTTEKPDEPGVFIHTFGKRNET